MTTNGGVEPPANGGAEQAGNGAEPPSVLRRLDTPGAETLVDLTSTFEDLQTVLRCCERLVTELGRGPRADDVVVEGLWTTAVLSYARCFSTEDAKARVSTDDLTEVQPEGDVLQWHTVILQLRDHYADARTNPRERFSVGVAQDSQGAPSGIAITSTRQPLVDDVTVRQTGAIAYALSRLVDDRITATQKEVFGQVSELPPADLANLEQMEVAP